MCGLAGKSSSTLSCHFTTDLRFQIRSTRMIGLIQNCIIMSKNNYFNSVRIVLIKLLVPSTNFHDKIIILLNQHIMCKSDCSHFKPEHNLF